MPDLPFISRAIPSPSKNKKGCKMTSPRKSTVFCVSGFAITQPDDILDETLKAVINSNPTKGERCRIEKEGDGRGENGR